MSEQRAQRPTIPTRPWIGDAAHCRWLEQQTDALLRFYGAASPDPRDGGFFWVDGAGRPVAAEGKQLWINARMVYAFVIGTLLGRPGCAPQVEQGLEYLRGGPLHDSVNGGWFWAVRADGTPSDDTKQAYGHAFVLLSAAAGRIAGFDTADLWAEVTEVLDKHFWDPDAGLYADTWNADFTELEAYRGQNANMHLVEALMLAAEVDNDPAHLDRAVSVAERLIRRITADNDWRLPEHFDTDWNHIPDYGKDDTENLFRPYGSTVGHWLEWARLLLQLHAETGDRTAWIPDAARTLFERAVSQGWDTERGGFVFSTDWSGAPADRDRYHWVIAEAIGAAVALYRTTGDPAYDRWYRIFWEYAEAHLIDAGDRSWIHQLDPANRPSNDAWDGKPDLYHALQETLFARIPFGGSLIAQLVNGRLNP